jgi:hypothetical protein
MITAFLSGLCVGLAAGYIYGRKRSWHKASKHGYELAQGFSQRKAHEGASRK